MKNFVFSNIAMTTFVLAVSAAFGTVAQAQTATPQYTNLPGEVIPPAEYEKLNRGITYEEYLRDIKLRDAALIPVPTTEKSAAVDRSIPASGLPTLPKRDDE